MIDSRGHILTNEHVVARADRIRITMADGREFDATVLGADPNNDIAVLLAETDEKLPWTSRISTSARLRRSMASSRSRPCAMILPIIGS